MKFDELKSLKNLEVAFNTTTGQEQVIAEDSEGYCYGFDSWEEVYLKDEVDAAIAELKAKLEEKDSFIKTLGEGQADLAREIERLKQKLEDAKASAYAESVDAGMENRRLKRALYKACANWADVMAFEETEGIGYDNSVAERWRKMESKCLKKVEEYK